MKPIPEKHEEKELLVKCSYKHAKSISERVAKKFPNYDFWCVDSKESGLYVGTGLVSEDYCFVRGYALAVLDDVLLITGESQ